MNSLLTIAIINRVALCIMAAQKRPYDEAFDARYAFCFSAYDLMKRVDDFAEAYLFEAADTMMNRQQPPRGGALELPYNVESVRDTLDCITLRTVAKYQLGFAEYRFIMDAQYRPHPVLEMAA